MNTLFPVFIKLEKLNVLIVGGGNVALEKLNALLSNCPEANITVCAPIIKSEIMALAKNHKITFEKTEYNNIYLQNKQIVIATTDSPAVNKIVSADCNAYQILVNVADTPDLCDFYLGSVVKKGDLKIGISTNGKSPTFAKRFREVLEDILPDNLQDTLDNLQGIRKKLKGDFNEKLNVLNQITKNLVDKPDHN